MRITILKKCWNLVFVPNLGPKKDADCESPTDKGKQIRIRAGLRGQRLLEVLIHECLHAADWSKDEEWVQHTAHDIARAAFRPGVYERIFQAPDTTES